MKSILFTFTIIIFLQWTSTAQYNEYHITFEGNGYNENDNQHVLYIDTIANPNNIWQIGAPQKTIFTQAFSLPNVIVTDTINDYPVNDTSSFILAHILDAPYSRVEIEGRYWVNSDTLTDFGTIEVSGDQLTWHNMLQWNGYTYWVTPIPVLSGNSNDWVQFEFSVLANDFGVDQGDTLWFRFGFLSDGMQTFKNGLMYDDLLINEIYWSIDEHNSYALNSISYPSPATNNVSIKFEKQITEATYFNIYDYCGKLVECTKYDFLDKNMNVNISNFAPGIYAYTLTNFQGEIFAGGKFIKIE